MTKTDLIHIADAAFETLKKAYEGETCRVIIPKRRDRCKRVSEQEFKMAFIQTILQQPEYSSLSFSVETPTENTYLFGPKSNRFNDFLPNREKDGCRSGCIDLTLYHGSEKAAIIEFKSAGAGEYEIHKDLFKLVNEPGENVIRAMIQIFEHGDISTTDAIKRKMDSSNVFSSNSEILYIGYCLDFQKEQGRNIRIIHSRNIDI